MLVPHEIAPAKSSTPVVNLDFWAAGRPAGTGKRPRGGHGAGAIHLPSGIALARQVARSLARAQSPRPGRVVCALVPKPARASGSAQGVHLWGRPRRHIACSFMPFAQTLVNFSRILSKLGQTRPTWDSSWPKSDNVRPDLLKSRHSGATAGQRVGHT